MSESVVQKKLAKLILQEVSHLLAFEVKIAPGSMITLSVVRVTGDLSIAKIYVTVLPDKDREEIVEALNERDWEIRKALAARIRNKVRKIPELRFYYDDSFDEARKIDELLK